MVDGSFTGSGLKLHTNAFTLEELNLLIEAPSEIRIFLLGLLLIFLIEKKLSILYTSQKVNCN